jgi:hypothetical protein
MWRQALSKAMQHAGVLKQPATDGNIIGAAALRILRMNSVSAGPPQKICQNAAGIGCGSRMKKTAAPTTASGDDYADSLQTHPPFVIRQHVRKLPHLREQSCDAAVAATAIVTATAAASL